MHTIQVRREKVNGVECMERKNVAAASFVRSFLLAVILTGVFLLVQAFLIYRMELPEKVSAFLLAGTYVFANLIAGVRLGKRVEHRKFMWGMLLGLVYFLVLFLLSFLQNGLQLPDIQKAILVFFLCVGGGTFGGMIS